MSYSTDVCAAYGVVVPEPADLPDGVEVNEDTFNDACRKLKIKCLEPDWYGDGRCEIFPVIILKATKSSADIWSPTKIPMDDYVEGIDKEALIKVCAELGLTAEPGWLLYGCTM